MNACIFNFFLYSSDTLNLLDAIIIPSFHKVLPQSAVAPDIKVSSVSWLRAGPLNDSRSVSHFFHFGAGALTATHIGTAVVLLNKTPLCLPSLSLSPRLPSLTLSPSLLNGRRPRLLLPSLVCVKSQESENRGQRNATFSPNNRFLCFPYAAFVTGQTKEGLWHSQASGMIKPGSALTRSPLNPLKSEVLCVMEVFMSGKSCSPCFIHLV